MNAFRAAIRESDLILRCQEIDLAIATFTKTVGNYTVYEIRLINPSNQEVVLNGIFGASHHKDNDAHLKVTFEVILHSALIRVGELEDAFTPKPGKKPRKQSRFRRILATK